MPVISHWPVVMLLIGGGGAWCFWFGFRSLAKGRAIRDTPTSRIRSAAQGYAEFTGVGALPARVTIKGPLTGIECAWWEYRIEERGGRTDRRSGWHTIDAQKSEAPFLLDDGTGRCLVDPHGAEVVPHARTVWCGSTPWPEYRLPPGEGVFGKLVDALFSGGRYRYVERRLSVAEPLYALGEFRTTGGVGVHDPEDDVAQVLHDWKRDQGKLLERFDADRDGKLNLAEWEQVRAAARQQVLQQRTAMELEPTVPVLREPDDGRPFLLSAVDQSALATRFRLQAATGIGLFVGCVAALAWLARNVA